MPTISGATGTLVAVTFAEVLTDQATSSTSYTDLATAGPSVTVTVGGSGKVLVGFNSQFDLAGAGSLVSVVLSGANTVAASDNWSLYDGGVTNGEAKGRTYVFTGLTAGSTTFKMQYKSPGAGSAGFQRRSIWAIPL